MARLDIHGGAEGRRDLLFLVQEAFGIGPGNPHAGAPGDRGDLVLHRGTIAALLRKAGGDDNGIPDADRGTFLQCTDHRAGGNDDHRKIDRRADIGDGAVALQPFDLAVVPIDRINLARIVVLAQHRQ